MKWNRILTPVKQYFPSRKSKTGVRSVFVVSIVEGEEVGKSSSKAFSVKVAATTLFIFGSKSFVIISDFKVPS